MNQRAYVIIFTIVICATAGGVLKGAQVLTQRRIDANMKFEKQENIAGVLGIDGFEKIRQMQVAQRKLRLDTLFREQVEEVRIDVLDVPGIGRFDKYVFYEYHETPAKEKVLAYAFPISGGGFQGMINGYMGVAADQKTITGVTFYDNTETPGLGGRISSNAPEDVKIREQFKRKLINYQVETPDGKRTVDFDMVKGTSITPKNGDRRVEAITAATQTSNAIGLFLKRNIETFYAALEERGELKPNLRQVVTE